MRFLKKVRVGLRRSWLRIAASTFFVYSLLWTGLESLSFLFAWLEPQGLPTFGTMVGVGLVVSCIREFPPDRVQLAFAAINTTIDVEFGDLFDSQGYKVIAVNEFFDSEIGAPVSPHSLHGQLITRFFRSQAVAFEAAVDASLRGERYEQVMRTNSRNKRYDIGTTPEIQVNGEQFLLPVLTHTDLSTFKASCDVPTLWKALMGLWTAVRNKAGGASVTVPLIGGGQAGIGLAPPQLLQLILLSIISASRTRDLGSKIRIVLPEECFEAINLREIEKHWS